MNTWIKRIILNFQLFPLNMIQEVIIFNKINSRPEFNYSGAEISKRSGFEKSMISRFLNGKSEMGMAKFFHLMRSMPPSFQQAYWEEVLGIQSVEKLMSSHRIPWSDLIAKANFADIEEILKAVTNYWSELEKSQEKATKAKQLVNV